MTPEVTADGTARHPSVVLASACACTLVVMGLVAAVNLAVPMLASSGLHPNAAQLLWIVDAYVVVFACLVIPGGAAGDRFGHKRALLTGLALFAAGAAISAVSPGAGIMLAGRGITGVGAALVLPNCVGVLVRATKPERRVRALAAWGAVSGMGGVVGNLGGGALLATGSWRALFASVALAALACGLAVFLLTAESGRGSRSLDPAGTGLLVAAGLALLTGIIEGPEHGWGSGIVVAAFACSAALGAAWILVELRSTSALLDPRLFRIPALSSACLGMLVTFFGSFGLFYLNASLLQYGRGYSTVQTGLAILPLAVPLLIVSRFVPGLVRRLGIPAILAVAFLAISVGLFGLATATRQPYPVYAIWLCVIGIGFALALPSLTTELTTALPSEQAGVAGGLQSATRELGSALGVAVVGTVLMTGFARHLPAALGSPGSVPRTVAEALSAIPDQHAVTIDAFVTAAGSALRMASVVILVAGTMTVVAAARAASRRSRRSGASSGAIGAG